MRTEAKFILINLVHFESYNLAPINGLHLLMAKKAAAKIGLIPPTPQIASVRVIIKDDEDVPTYYINYAEVSMGMHDCSLTAAKIPNRIPPSSQSAIIESGELRVEPLLQLVFPPTVIPGLIKALTLQKEIYEKFNGEIREPTFGPNKLSS
jgi:hypothetical protein